MVLPFSIFCLNRYFPDHPKPLKGEAPAKLLEAIENRHSGQGKRDPESRNSKKSGFRLR